MSVCARCRLLHTVGKIEGISFGTAVLLLLHSLVGGAKGWLHHSQPWECLKQPISVCPHGKAAAHCTTSLVQKGKTYSYSHTLGEETEDDTARSRGPLMVNHSLYLIQSPFSPSFFFFFSFYPRSVFLTSLSK